MQQLQHENERLLTEFRAERSRREEFERVNRTLEARLSESEKLLARQTQGAAANRVSSLQPGPSKPLTPANAADEPSSASDADEFRWQRRVK